MAINKGVAVGVGIPAVIVGSGPILQYYGPKMFAEAAG